MNSTKTMETKGWIEITYVELIEKVITEKPILVTTEGFTCYYKPLSDKTTEIHIGGPILDTKPDVGNV